MQDALYQKQIELEEKYSHASVLASIKQTQDALDQGRFADIGIGKRIVAKAYQTVHDELTRILSAKRAGQNVKYLALLRRVDVDILAIAGLRAMLGFCTQKDAPTVQDAFRGMGNIVESEAIIAAVEQRNPVYAEKTLDYLHDAGTTNVNHRKRTFATAAHNLKMEMIGWTGLERVHVGRILCTALYTTGLFKLVNREFDSHRKMFKDVQVIVPSDELVEYIDQALDAARSIIKYPPMLVPPTPRESATVGGYLTDWYQTRAEMVSLRAPRKVRKWVYSALESPEAATLRTAMTKAQNVSYRVSLPVLEVLSQAVAMGGGVLGVPLTLPAPKPEFPFADGWDKDAATPDELKAFTDWKQSAAGWYTAERTRAGQNAGLTSRLRELRQFKDYDRLYFPTFVDWRGRLYFRSSINPQNSDFVKACLELTDGKPLGERGLFWLKVQVANCAGYDKHSPEIKAKWTDDNIAMLTEFMENPLDVAPPEVDTACTLYQAMRALTQALSLPDPTKYVCHVPVAMDATCSGLQHFSAMLRDPIGALYTNLVDNQQDQKSDIYKHVGQLADGIKHKMTDDPVILDYWKDKPITRAMAKRPVMTYVYGSTLQSTMEYLCNDMRVADMPVINDEDGKCIYSHNKLSVTIGKALRAAVKETVPAAAAGMQFLHSLVRASDYPIKWVTPVGMPVVNWGEELIQKRIAIRSMGRQDAICSMYSGEYSRAKAVSGIAPNFIHSLDSAHLCMVIAAADFSIVPIHDSFGALPSDVDNMHKILRETFVELYQRDHLNELASTVFIRQGEDIVMPKRGTFDINEVLNARYMFC